MVLQELACMPQTLADYIKARRAFLGLNQQALAERMGVSQSYVSQLEVGKIKGPLTPDMLERLSQGLETSREAIARDTGYIESELEPASSSAEDQLWALAQDVDDAPLPEPLKCSIQQTIQYARSLLEQQGKKHHK